MPAGAGRRADLANESEIIVAESGKSLTEEGIARARRDQADPIALHTNSIMTVAPSMYECLGFSKAADAPPICGVPYGVYVLRLR